MSAAVAAANAGVAVLDPDDPGPLPPLPLGPSRMIATPPTPAAQTPRVDYPAVLRVSPLRAEARPAEFGGPYGEAIESIVIAPAEPMPTYAEPSGTAPTGDDAVDEPPLPEEIRDAVRKSSSAPTIPTEAPPSGVLHVRFNRTAATDRLVDAMEQVRSLFRSRPGGTPVVIHLPQGGGRDPLPMELRSGVAYDADLLAEVSRRLGAGIVEIRLG